MPGCLRESACMFLVAMCICQATAFVGLGSLGLAGASADSCRMPSRSLRTGALVTFACRDASSAVNRAAQALIREAITTGVPKFNSGDAQGCARVYEECCRDILALPGAIDAETGASTDLVLKEMQSLSSESAKAWTLRRQLDALLCLLASAAQAPDAVASAARGTIPKTTDQQVGNRTILADFSSSAQVASWQGVNDVVMGGSSTGFISQEATEAERGAVGVFQGVVTAAGGGGFSSIRSAPLAMDCSSSSGLSVLCKGDGRVYKLQVTCDRLAPGVKYQVEFATSPGGEWVEHLFGWDEFVGSLRGNRVLGAPALNGQPSLVVTSLGLLTSKLSSSGTADSRFQTGPFRLELSFIAAHA